ncbi:permease-like cell division protein FtsX [Micromonospora auratinigra]|uniref:FtsX extracellular domain-containing protein n=1 Tax=Micromonospora auratinigra TaxID=261654 RepID=A0A1A8ZUY8_9ACTN|nr:permease-like cell division protein FtsX [Micromonospora auratinigra]SBT47927.1 hypothetical protein GA0070611_3901 [Micromonospora auratinigra]
MFLFPDVTAGQRRELTARLKEIRTVDHVDQVSRAEQWRRFAAVYCDAPDVVAATRPEDLPVIAEVIMAPGADPVPVVDAVRHLGGVDEVTVLD